MDREASRNGRQRPRRGRRLFTGLLIAISVVLALPASALGFVILTWFAAETSTAGAASFHRPLPVPPLASSTVDARGRRVFDLKLQTGRTDFGLRQPTATWGVNGSYLGPTLRARRGEHVLVNVTNQLGERSTLHWHGMHLPPRMDGGPHQLIEPGSTWSPSWKVDQPAATLWYHPHLHGETAQHVYRGLAGMFVVDDSAGGARGLPSEYGVDDVPVIVQDKKFTRAGQLGRSSSLFFSAGTLGDTILVNGAITPHHGVSTSRVRLRLLNASNARIYNFGFADDRAFDLVATDGGLLPSVEPTQRVRLSPGERAEIVVSMEPREDAVLRSFPVDLGADMWNQRFGGGDDTFDVLQLRADDQLRSLPGPYHPPTPDREPRVQAATTTRTFRLGGATIDGKKMHMGRVDEVVTLGTTEVWEVHNASGTIHNFHVHDVQFRVLDVDGRRPPPEQFGPKDTVYVPPGSTVRLVLTFTDYADRDSPYMFHCHLLRHEDAGMMGQFVVVRPGEHVEERLPGHHT